MPSCRADAKPLMVGQAAVFHLDHKVAYNTVFNPETIEQLAKGKTADELRRALESQKSDPRVRRLERDRAASRAGRIRVHRLCDAGPVRSLGGRGRARAAADDGTGTRVVRRFAISRSAEISTNCMDGGVLTRYGRQLILRRWLMRGRMHGRTHGCDGRGRVHRQPSCRASWSIPAIRCG